MQRRNIQQRFLRKRTFIALLLTGSAYALPAVTAPLAATISTLAESQVVTPPTSLEAPQQLPLSRARYLSDGVYLGHYPGFIAPGHSINGTYFLPANASLLIHIEAQPYQGVMPAATLLINGQLIAEFTEFDTQVLQAPVPENMTGKLAEITIAFAGYTPTGGSIKLDSVRTPMNIPLLHINALVMQAEPQGPLLSRD